MIVMIDSVPGFGKKSIIHHIWESNPHYLPMAENLVKCCPVISDLFSLSKTAYIGISGLSIELAIISYWGDVIRRLQDDLAASKTVLIETSIFWPVVWIELFGRYYWTTEEFELISKVHGLMVERFIKFLMEKEYHLLHIYLKSEMDSKFKFLHIIGGKPFSMHGLFLQNHPDLFKLLDRSLALEHFFQYYSNKDPFFASLHKSIKVVHSTKDKIRSVEEVASDITKEISIYRREIEKIDDIPHSIYACYEDLFCD